MGGGKAEGDSYHSLAYLCFISDRAARIVFASSAPKASRPSLSESMTAASAFISLTA